MTTDRQRLAMTMMSGPGYRYRRGRRVPVITPRQRDVLDFIVHHIVKHAYPPTNREITRGLGLSSSWAAALHQREVGYDVTKTDMVGEQAIELSRHIAPDIRACIFWLQRRRPREWCPRAASGPTVSAS